MTITTKKILIIIGSLTFGLISSIIQNDLGFSTILVLSLLPIILSLILIYTILISIFEKNYEIEYFKTFYTFWVGTMVLSIIGTIGTLI
jgi:hypothetical protein